MERHLNVVNAAGRNSENVIEKNMMLRRYVHRDSDIVSIVLVYNQKTNLNRDIVVDKIWLKPVKHAVNQVHDAT